MFNCLYTAYITAMSCLIPWFSPYNNEFEFNIIMFFMFDLMAPEIVE